MIEAAELIDNDFLRQFEVKVDDELAKIEYSLQERKIFLTKLILGLWSRVFLIRS